MPGLTYKIRFIFLSTLVVFLGVSLLSSCTKADATTKKDKTKQSKPKTEPEADEPDKKDEKTEPDAEPTNTKTEDKKPSTDEKKTEPLKEPVKSPVKSDVKTDKTNKTKEKKDDKKTTPETQKVKKVSADVVWQGLIKGNKQFMAGGHTSVNFSSARQSLLKGQSPDVVVLGCADSRVPPEFVFNKNLGELFVVRDAGNVADKVSLGSIEYAVEHLHSSVLVVLGHESCGAVAATVSGEKMPSANLTAITDSILPAFTGSKICIIGGPSNLSCVELNVKQSSKDILAKSAILKKAVDEGRLTIIRAVYKMGTGEVVRLD